MTIAYCTNRYVWGVDPRALKKHENKMMGRDREVKSAFNLGCYHAMYNKPKRNHYPPGRRHDEYERGYDWEADGQHALT